MTNENSVDWPSMAANFKATTDPYISGKPYASLSKERIDHINPVTLEVDYQFVECNDEDIDAAVSAARESFDVSWGAVGPGARKKMLCNLANLIDSNAQSLGLCDSLDMGKSVTAANQEAHIAAGFIRYYAEMIDKVHSGHTVPTGNSALEMQVMRPRGVVGVIIPWNFPVINVALKIGPALAAGNTVVIKPSELTPRSALLVADLATQAGLPSGTVNVVTGAAKAGDLLVRHSDIDMLTFTGSTSTGKAILRSIGDSSIKPVLLECGGKSPEIIFPDAIKDNLEAVAQAIVRGAFWNQGQVCVARSRLLVHSSIYQELLAKVVAVADSMRVGDPLDVNCVFGPLASGKQREIVEQYIESGIEDGATLLLDGRNPQGGETGCYVGPTIFSDVPPSARIAQEEIFGPVLTVFSFDDEDEALALANDSEYGLAATVWTRDLVRANRFANQIKAGKVRVATTPEMVEGAGFNHSAEPAGQSGYGVEGGRDGLFSYMRKQSIEYVLG